MSKEITTWFAVAAFAALTITMSGPGTVVAQPPGRGPGGPEGRGGPPNVAEMFSRMDRNNDGKLTEDEVPEPMWNRLSNADANDDGGVTKDEATKAMSGRRPDGARPAAPRDERSREESSPSRGPRPPLEQGRGDPPRGDSRGRGDASPERGRPASPRSSNQPDRDTSGRPDSAHRGPAPFGADAFFDRMDKNRDGSLSRDEFKAVAELHRGPQAPRGPQALGRHPGPGGPPSAHHGPGMRGGPPWAHHDRGNFEGPQRFQGGPPWARSGHGPQFNSRFAGPPWAHSAHGPRGPRDGASHQGRRHRNAVSRDRSSHKRERSRSRRPDRTDANARQSGAQLTEESQSASPSDDSVTASTPAKASKTATLPL